MLYKIHRYVCHIDGFLINIGRPSDSFEVRNFFLINFYPDLILEDVEYLTGGSYVLLTANKWMQQILIFVTRIFFNYV